MRWALAALVAVAMFPATAFAADTIGVGGSTFLFVPGESIRIMDVTAPHTPLQVAEIPVHSWEFSHIPVGDDTYLAAVGADGILHIIDVTIPYRPVPVSTLPVHAGDDISDVDWTMSAGRTFALLSAGDAIHMIDVTNPQNPTSAGDIRNDGFFLNSLYDVQDTESFWIESTPYILAAGTESVQLVNLQDVAYPVGASAIHQGQYGFATIGSLQDVDVIEAKGGAYALVLGKTSLMVADITEPEHPVHVDTIRFNSLLEIDVLESDDALYALIMCIDKIHVIDLQNPDSPVHVSTVRVPTAGVAGIESDGRHWALSVGEYITAVDITDPESPVPSHIQPGGPPHAPEAVETAIIGGNPYILTASVGRNTIQITDITNPDSPVPVSAVTGNQHAYGAIHGPHDVAVTHTDGRTYAVVPNTFGNSVTILDVTDPHTPQIASNTKLPVLAAPMAVAVVEIGSATYAAVAGHYIGGIQLLDITDAHSPILGVRIQDDRFGFESVEDPLSLDAIIIDGSPYILAVSYFGGSMQVIDVSNPSHPVPAAAMQNGIDGHRLHGAHDVKAIHTQGGTYAVVSTAHDSGISIIDITDPHDPVMVSHVTDGRDGFEHLDTVQHLDVINHNGRTLVAATSYFDNTIQLMDMTEPGNPIPLPSAVLGQDGFESIIGPTSISALTHEGRTYVAVADYFGNGIQIAEITGDNALEARAALAAGIEASVNLAVTTGIEAVTISGRTYALTATPSQDAVQITDVTHTPAMVSVIRGGEDGFVLDQPAGIEAGYVAGRHYAFVTGIDSGTIQVIDISDPAAPEPVHLMQDMGWVMETEFTRIGQTPYLVAGTLNGDTLYVMDVSKPSRPEVAGALADAVAGFQGLDVIHAGENVWAIVFSFDHGVMNIIDITDPANPHRISTTAEEYMQSMTDADAVMINDRVLAVVSSYQTDTISILDITDPLNPVRLSSLQGRDGGHYLHGPESVEVVVIGAGVFVVIANGNDSMQIMDITDPLNPAAAATTGSLFGFISYGVTDVKTFQTESGTYLIYQTIDENTTRFLDITDPYDLAAFPSIPPLHHIHR